MFNLYIAMLNSGGVCVNDSCRPCHSNIDRESYRVAEKEISMYTYALLPWAVPGEPAQPLAQGSGYPQTPSRVVCKYNTPTGNGDLDLEASKIIVKL